MLLLEPDAGRFQMLWRAALAVDKSLLKLSSVTVSSRSWDAQGRPLSPLSGLGRLPGAYAAA
jgi:hypothetical protein